MANGAAILHALDEGRFTDATTKASAINSVATALGVNGGGTKLDGKVERIRAVVGNQFDDLFNAQAQPDIQNDQSQNTAPQERPQETREEITPDRPIDIAAANFAATSPHNNIAQRLNPEENPKANTDFQGIPIAIENVDGSKRYWKDGSGSFNVMSGHYGEIPDATGADKDPIDVFVKNGLTHDDIANATTAYVIDQVDPDIKGRPFDEHKVMLGYASPEEALAAYQSNYDEGWDGAENITPVSMVDLKEWLKHEDTTKPFAAPVEPTDTEPMDRSMVPNPEEQEIEDGWAGLDEPLSEEEAAAYVQKLRDLRNGVTPTAPVAEQQAPVAEQQAPVAEQQAPVAEQQAPVAEQQAPVAEQQAPKAPDAPAQAAARSKLAEVALAENRKHPDKRTPGSFKKELIDIANSLGLYGYPKTVRQMVPLIQAAIDGKEVLIGESYQKRGYHERKSAPIDTSRDELRVALAKRGGVSRADAEGIDPETWAKRHSQASYRGLNNELFKEDGLTVSSHLETMKELGYLPESADDHDLMMAIYESERGNPTYTPEGWENQAKKDIEDREYEAQEEAKEQGVYELPEFEDLPWDGEYDEGDGPKFSRQGASDATKQFQEVEARYFNADGSAKEGALMAPNGEPSNLSKQQWIQVRTDNFKQFYGDWESNGLRLSDIPKVVSDDEPAQRTFSNFAGFVDDNGEPLVMFHGTADSFNVFDVNHPNRKDTGWLSRGVYTTNDIRMAKTYSNIKAGNGEPTEMPLFSANKKIYVASLQNKKYLKQASQAKIDEITESFKKDGYDGVVLRYDDETVELVTFAPSNIKSATLNNGGFSKTTDDIRFSKAQNEVKETFSNAQEAISTATGAFGKGIERLVNQGVLIFTQGKEKWPISADKLNGNEEAMYHKGKVYVDLNSTSKDRLDAVLLHEIGEHYNLRKMLGEQGYRNLINQITNRAKIPGSLAQQVWNDVKENYDHLTEGSDSFMAEVIAKLGERSQTQPWYRRLISQVKAYLVKVGLGRGFLSGMMTENDLNSLLRASLHSAGNPLKGDEFRANVEMGPQFSRLSDWLDGVKDGLGEASKNARSQTYAQRLAFLTVRQIASGTRKFLPGLGDYVHAMTERTNSVDRELRRSQHTMEGWKALPKAMKHKLDKLMQDSRKADTDLSRAWSGVKQDDETLMWEAYNQTQFGKVNRNKLEAIAAALGGVNFKGGSARFSNPATAQAFLAELNKVAADQDAFRASKPNKVDVNVERKAAYRTFAPDFAALSPKAKEIYSVANKQHNDIFAARLRALEDQITADVLDSSARQRLIAQLRAEFESKSLNWYYAPLSRFGDHWFYGKNNTTGKMTFRAFQSDIARDEYATEFTAKGGTQFGIGTNIEGLSKLDMGISSAAFITDVLQQIDKSVSDANARETIKDEIYQMMLASLPEISMRHSAQHSENVEGYETDQLRSFAHAMHHGATQLANMIYGTKMREALEEAKETYRITAIHHLAKTQAELDATRDLKFRWATMESNNVPDDQIAGAIRAENDLRKATLNPNDPALKILEAEQALINKFTGASAKEVHASLSGHEQKLDTRIERSKLITPENSRKASDAINEVYKSYEDAMRSNSSSMDIIAQRVRALGFIYMLGFGVSSGLVNILQTPGVAMPVVIGRHGTVDTLKAFGKTLQEFNQARSMGWAGNNGWSYLLSGQKAYTYLYEKQNAAQIAQIETQLAAAKQAGNLQAVTSLKEALNNVRGPAAADEDGNWSITQVLKLRRLEALKANNTALADELEDEITFFEEIKDAGDISRTQTFDHAGVGAAGEEHGGKLHELTKSMGWMFHHGERANREMTLLAAYRLERDKLAKDPNTTPGTLHERAMAYAREVNTKAHFDYTAENAARLFRGPLAGVAFQFKKYQQSMLWLWGSTAAGRIAYAKNAWEKLPPGPERDALQQEIKEAARTFNALFVLQGAFAGALGMPLTGAIMVILNMIGNLVPGDDDEPWDTERELRTTLTDWFGETGATLLTKGIGNALTPINLADRTSMHDLLFRQPIMELEGRDAATNYLASLTGPFGSILQNVAEGLKLGSDGHVYRAFEQSVPKVIKDVMKAGRYAMEDARSLDGQKIKDINAAEAFLQALGFSSSNLEVRYAERGYTKAAEHAITDLRNSLVSKAAHAKLDGEPLPRVEIVEWNKKHPNWPIKADSIKRSIKAIQEHTKNRQERGYEVNPKLGYLVDKYNLT